MRLATHLIRVTTVAAVATASATCCPKSAATQQPTLPGSPAEPTPLGAQVGDGDVPPVLVFPEEPFRATQPEATAPRPFQLPAVTTFTLDNGIDVYLVERHQLPVVSLELSFDGGSMNDPRGKEGLAEICMGMLTEGTEDLEKIAFNEALADIASAISTSAREDTQSISMSALRKHLDATFALFVDTLLRPGLRQVDFDRMIKRRLEALKQERGSANSVVKRIYRNVLYGPGHPFGRLITERSLGAIKLRDCALYGKAYLAPKGARLFVYGDLTEAELREQFKGLVAEWKGRPKRSVALPKPRSRKGKLFFVDIPGSTQSAIWFLQFGPNRKAEDYIANQLMMTLLGGGMGSRLMTNLREDKGYTYGAYGMFFYRRDYGVLLAAADVDGRTTWQAVQEIYREMNDLRGPDGGTALRPATGAELERDRNGAILSLPSEFATGRQILGNYRELVQFGLPLDYYGDYVPKLTAVRLEDVNASARKHLRPDDAVILVAGDAKAPLIEREGDKDVDLLGPDGKPVLLVDGLKQLAKSGALGKGALVVLDADGKVVATHQ